MELSAESRGLSALLVARLVEDMELKGLRQRVSLVEAMQDASWDQDRD